MFQHILLPTDGSRLSTKAVKQAIKVAAALGARITAMTVVGKYQSHLMNEGFIMPDVPAMQKRFEKAESAAGKKILEAVRQSAAEADVKCDFVIATSDFPYDAIIKQARKS
jgi:nucleotide-binding universal stress UspA family protein